MPVYRAYIGIDQFLDPQDNVPYPPKGTPFVVEIRPPGDIDGYGATLPYQRTIENSGPSAPTLHWTSSC